MIKFRCHYCNKKIGVEDRCVGRRVWCPRCRVLTVVPKPECVGDERRNPNEETVYSVYICHNDTEDRLETPPSPPIDVFI